MAGDKAAAGKGGIMAASHDRQATREAAAASLCTDSLAGTSSLLQSNSSLLVVGEAEVNQEEEPESMIEVEPDSDLAYQNIEQLVESSVEDVYESDLTLRRSHL